MRDTIMLVYQSHGIGVNGRSTGDRELIEGIQFEVDLSAHYDSVMLHTDASIDLHDSHLSFSSSFYFVLETTLMDKCIVFAEGGHFEQLIYTHRPPSMQGKQLLALGVRFSIDKLLRIAVKSVVFCNDTASPCDAIVMFHSKDTCIDHRLSLPLVTLLNSLRDNGIRSIHTLSFNSFKYARVGASAALKDASFLCERLGIPYLIKLHVGATDAASDVN
jgi:hypothetical protein